METDTTVLNSTSIESDSGLSGTVGDTFQLMVQIVIFLFGVPGNCLILRVYWTKTQKTSTHVFIMALAWADLTVCVVQAVRRIYNAVASMAGHQVQDFTFIIWAFGATAISTSIMLTAVIAADRYDCICRPHRRFFTHRRGKIAAWAAFVFSLVVSIPAYIPRNPASSDPFWLHLKLAFQVVNFVVALVMIAVCYGNVYRTVRKHTKVGVRLEGTTRDGNASQMADQCSTNTQQNVPAVASVSTFISKQCSITVDDVRKAVKSEEAPNFPNDETTIDNGGTKLVSDPKAATKNGPVSKARESGVTNGNTDSRQHQGTGGRVVPNADAAVVQRKTTRMLFITSVVFLLTWLPYWMLIAATFGLFSNPVLQMILEHLYVTLYVNNAVNPLIYGLANRRFRKDCRAVLNKMKPC